MHIHDVINSGFEVGAGFFVLNHCLTLYRDKRVAGVSVLSTAFFLVFGFWNMYYYPTLNQWASFYGGLFIALANCIYVSMLLYYRKRG